MEFSFKLFISILFLLPVASFGAHNSSIYQLVCNKNFSSNHDNILQMNIKNTISNLAAHIYNNNTYAISSYGIGYDTIYGLVQCRGDAHNESCSSCVSNAVHQIRTFCQYSAEVRIWYPFCFLRYDNYNFYGQADSSYTRVWPSALTAQINAETFNFNAETFNSQLGTALHTSIWATVGDDLRFGGCISEDWHNNNITYVYGIAQCTRDLDYSGCSYCLEKALEVMSNDCKNHFGCTLISSSCMFRYEIYDLFLEAESPSPRHRYAVSSSVSNIRINLN